MATSPPHQESHPATLPAPCPTQPVAGRPTDTDTPVFDWTPVPDATHYRVQIASTEAFETVHYDETTDYGDAVPLGPVLPDDVTTAYWRVRAEGAEESRSDWSAPACFARPSAEMGAEEETSETAPVPLHPTQEQDPPVEQSAVPFTWERVPGATGYGLQVAPTEGFAEPVIDLTVDQTTSITLYDTLPPDGRSFYWRVRPLHRVADPGPWSAAVPFAVAPPAGRTEELAPEAEGPQSSARAAGPATRARTSKAASVIISLIAVLSFIATIALIILAG